MSESKTVVKSGGIGVLSLLGVLFVGLKLGHVINWSWWWVTLPFWGGLAIGIAFFAIAALLFGIATALERHYT